MAFKRNEVALVGRGRDNSYEGRLEELERRLKAAEDKTEKIGGMLGLVLQTLADSSKKQEHASKDIVIAMDELLGAALKSGVDEGDGER